MAMIGSLQLPIGAVAGPFFDAADVANAKFMRAVPVNVSSCSIYWIGPDSGSFGLQKSTY